MIRPAKNGDPEHKLDPFKERARFRHVENTDNPLLWKVFRRQEIRRLRDWAKDFDVTAPEVCSWDEDVWSGIPKADYNIIICRAAHSLRNQWRNSDFQTKYWGRHVRKARAKK